MYVCMYVRMYVCILYYNNYKEKNTIKLLQPYSRCPLAQTTHSVTIQTQFI